MIPLFSPNGVDNSLIIPVFIGVLIASFMTERYGWVFSGLVVPGYLAPIFLAYPAAGVTITFEAILTYLIVRGFTDGAGWRRTHTPPFGRERFLAIVLVGIAVRLMVEELLVPLLVQELLGGGLAILAESRQIGAIGLVIVPLLANLMWRPGLWPGLRQATVATVAVLVILEFAVEPLTNFSLARIEVLYEDLALDFTESAKAQIVIACGCVVAAQLNIRYGWDFGGILIPPLLAVSLFQPMRFVATLTETVAVLAVARGLLFIPPFRTMTIVGPRITLYLFCVAMFLKVVVGWGMWYVAPRVSASDYFGFGYLLSTLLAAKVWSKGSKIAFFPTVYATVLSFVVGSSIAFGLKMIPLEESPAILPDALEKTVPGSRGGAVELAILARAEAETFGASRTLSESGRRELVVLLENALAAPGGGFLLTRLPHLQWLARGSAVGVEVVGESPGPRYLSLHPRHPERENFESVFVRIGRGPSTVLVAHRGKHHFVARMAAATLIDALEPEILIFDGSAPEDVPRYGSALAWLTRRQPDRPVLDLHGHAERATSLHAVGALPPQLSLRTLRETISVRAVIPAPADGDRRHWFARRMLGGHTEMHVGFRDAIDLLVVSLEDGNPPPPVPSAVQSLDALLDVPESQEEERPARPSGRTLVERLLLKEALLKGLLAVSEPRLGPIANPEDELLPSPDAMDEGLPRLGWLAGLLGLQLGVVEEPEGGREALVLHDGDPARWLDGTVLIALDGEGAHHVEVPSPVRYPGTYLLGVRLFQVGGVRTLSVGGRGHPGSGELPAEVSSNNGAASLFHLFHQALVEHSLSRGAEVAASLQVRGRSRHEEEDGDGVIAPMEILGADPTGGDRSLAPWRPLFEELGWHITRQDPGAADRHDIDHTLQARYRRLLGLQNICGLWIDARMRRVLLREEPDPGLVSVWSQLGFPLEEVSLRDWWQHEGYSARSESPEHLAPALEALFQYGRSGNLASLRQAAELMRSGGGRAATLLDPDGRMLLALQDPEHVLLVHPASLKRAFAGSGVEGLDAFLRLRSGVCIGERGP